MRDSKKELDLIFEEIKSDVFKDFSKMDKEVKRSFLTDNVKCWGFRSEEKAKKFIEQTHVIRGDAIVAFIDYLKSSFIAGDKYYLVGDKVLKKNIDKKEGVLLNENLDLLKENVLTYIKANWSMFPIGISVYDGKKDIGKEITTPNFIREYNKLSLLEKINKFYDVIMECQKSYVELGQLSDKLLDSLIFDEINKEINLLNQESADFSLNKINENKICAKQLREIKEIDDLIRKRKENSGVNVGECNIYLNFILKVGKYVNEDNIVNMMNYMITINGAFIIEEEYYKDFLKSIKKHMFELNMADRENFVQKYKSCWVNLYRNKVSKGIKKIGGFLSKENIKCQVEKGEIDFDDFVTEKTEVIWKKNINISKTFGNVYLNVDLSLFNSEKIQIRSKDEKISIDIFSDFEIKISNKELLSLISKTINETIRQENLRSGEGIYKEYDFNKGVNDMLNHLRLEQKIRESGKQEVETKIRTKI